MRDYIPQNLDQPERYLFFTADELFVVVAPLMILTVVANFLIGLIVGAFGFWVLRKFKQGASLHRIMWMGYWLLPSEVWRLQATPPSHIREMAG